MRPPQEALIDRRQFLTGIGKSAAAPFFAAILAACGPQQTPKEISKNPNSESVKAKLAELGFIGEHNLLDIKLRSGVKKIKWHKPLGGPESIRDKDALVAELLWETAETSEEGGTPKKVQKITIPLDNIDFFHQSDPSKKTISFDLAYGHMPYEPKNMSEVLEAELHADYKLGYLENDRKFVKIVMPTKEMEELLVP